jgi:peptidoglycan/LPS O-acetylase OafA/YrhL
MSINTRHWFGAITARLDAGVAVFFVISGFLLYRPFVAARLEGRPRPAVLRYARRRVLRILPAYWLALTVYGLVAPGWVHHPLGHDWWAYYLLIQNTSSTWILGGIPVAWSLCVEAAFYVALPLYALGAARSLSGRAPATQARLELWTLGAMAAASVAARSIVHHASPMSIFPQSLPGNLAWFAGGMTLAVLSAWQGHRPVGELAAPLRALARRPLAAWAAAAVVLLFLSFLAGLPRGLPFAYSGFTWFEEHVLYGVFAVLVVAPAVFGAHGLVARVLGNPVVQWLGLISYGIFLWHLPLSGHLGAAGEHGGFVAYLVVLTAAASGCAAASYYLVERPLLRLKEPRRDRRAAAPPRAAADSPPSGVA